MLRNIAVATAVLTCAAGAGRLAAQTASPTKPSTPQMHHAATRPTSASQVKSSATHHRAWTKADIEQAQQGLAKAGYYKGKPTGVWDADSRKALKAYQKANNMPQTGRLSDSVLVKLKSS
jgi:peptidoglycan hydrolase-like protein with peptidoglycan-binding domain